MIDLAPGIVLPKSELRFVASRSGGPGGQNVNKVNTRVTLLFDVGASPTLSEEQRRRIRERLASRISSDGILRVVSQRHRTQRANREAAVERFVELVRAALARDLERVPTRPTRAARERRVVEKKRHSVVKARRRAPVEVD